jgi:hypothetical protein
MQAQASCIYIKAILFTLLPYTPFFTHAHVVIFPHIFAVRNDVKNIRNKQFSSIVAVLIGNPSIDTLS